MVISSSTDVQTHWYGEEGEPLIVLMHDFMGRLAWAEALAKRCAASGFRVAVPDFYAGRSSTDPDDARALMTERLRDLSGVSQQLQEIIGEARAMGSEHVALVGFSMGTRLATAYAAEHPGVDAVVGYYGSPNDPAAHIRVPVLFQLGSDDVDDSGESDAHRLQAQMQEQGFDGIEIEVFTDARHGFQNEQNPEKFSQAASDRAFVRTVEFLNVLRDS